MKVLDIASTANGNLRRSKLRTFLTLLAIGIGTFTLSLSLGLGEGVRAYVTGQLGQYKGVNFYRVVRSGADGFGGFGFSSGDPKVYDDKKSQAANDISQIFLNDKDLQQIKSTPGVKDLTVPYSFTFLYVQSQDGKKYEAPASQAFNELPVHIVSGKTIAKDDILGVALSRKYVSLLGVNSSEAALGKTITFAYKDATGELQSAQLTVRGVFEPTLFDSPVTVSEGLAKQLAVLENPVSSQLYPGVFVTKKDGYDEAKMKANLTALKYSAKSISDLNKTLNDFISAVQTGLAGFSSVAILASVVGVVNTLFMAVLERTREIGLFRALGAKRKTIFMLFSVEAILLGFWGSLFGLVLAFGAQFTLNSVASRTFLKGVEGFKLLSITPSLVVVIIVGIAVVTLLAGILPALKASRLDPIEALRYE